MNTVAKKMKKASGNPTNQARVLTLEVEKVLRDARGEGVDDVELQSIIRELIRDLRDVRQNVMRYRKIERSERL